MDKFIAAGENIRSTLWRTSGARFNAARRWERRGRLSTFSIAVLSVVTIGLGLIDTGTHAYADMLFRLSITLLVSVISIFVLVISLIDGNSGSEVQATRLHDSGVRLRKIHGELTTLLARASATGSEDWGRLEQFQNDYSQELRECPCNHEPIDDLRFQADHRNSREFLKPDGNPRMSRMSSVGIRLRYLVSPAWLSLVSWAVVLGLIAGSINWSVLNSACQS